MESDTAKQIQTEPRASKKLYQAESVDATKGLLTMRISMPTGM